MPPHCLKTSQITNFGAKNRGDNMFDFKIWKPILVNGKIRGPKVKLSHNNKKCKFSILIKIE
jgi:hypothetical protein